MHCAPRPNTLETCTSLLKSKQINCSCAVLEIANTCEERHRPDNLCCQRRISTTYGKVSSSHQFKILIGALYPYYLTIASHLRRGLLVYCTVQGWCPVLPTIVVIALFSLTQETQRKYLFSLSKSHRRDDLHLLRLLIGTTDGHISLFQWSVSSIASA
ncbi:hypothetical protein L228DRAFT_153820 [Xylona heveae TC161]|uniref:Uncharacterized protein n=1 Tax=Xylona heveae (strain CBS 132557 / TC161) TaxID=1328760 RepID=A0A165FWH5_XYLHT|nr:hypothetical protein L228DRAFT_153820 [Xylona heveae TC161]KZF21467.1 hypothetical protein L228DRAFT_153820 [Xylona heveae TC161]